VAVAGATVSFSISGPESFNLTTGPTDANGAAEVSWNTKAPNRKGQGGTAAGNYTVTTTGVTASGYTWDQVPVNATFSLTP
jgi:hypothetical protein